MAGPEDVNSFRRILNFLGGPPKISPGVPDAELPPISAEDYSRRAAAQQKYIEQFRKLFGGRTPAETVAERERLPVPSESRSVAGGSGGPPAPPGGKEMAAPMPEGPEGRPSGRTYASRVPSTNVRAPVDLPLVRGATPRVGMSGPAAFATLLGAYAPEILEFLRRAPSQTGMDQYGTDLGAVSIPQIGSDRIAETPAEISPIPQGPVYGRGVAPMVEPMPTSTPRRPAPRRPAASQAVDPRFAAVLSQALAQPQAAPAAAPTPPPAPAPRSSQFADPEYLTRGAG